MECQFILRLPPELEHINLSEAKFIKLDDINVMLVYQNKEYKGHIHRPPTVIETHKIIDNKLYKIADITGIVEISSSGNFSEYVTLTPPMKWCKERRFKKYEQRIEMIEEIEKKVKELLEEDAKAIKVEIIQHEDEKIDEMAADLEMELNNEITMVNKEINDQPVLNNSFVEQQKKQLISQIQEKEQLIIKTTNPILKKRFLDEIEKLKAQLNLL